MMMMGFSTGLYAVLFLFYHVVNHNNNNNSFVIVNGFRSIPSIVSSFSSRQQQQQQQQQWGVNHQVTTRWLQSSSTKTINQNKNRMRPQQQRRVVLRRLATTTATTVSKGNAGDDDDDNDMIYNPTTKQQNHSNKKNEFVTQLQTIGQELFPNTLSASEIQQILVRRGLKSSLSSSSSVSSSSSQPWTSSKMVEDGDDLYDYYESPMVKVPGCVATVHVQTILVIPSTISTTNDQKKTSTTTTKVYIKGTSDAHVSRGLLTLICEAIHKTSTSSSSGSTPNQNQILQDILDMDPSQISQYLQIQSALSIGRNDGVSNIVQTIQQQIRDHQQQQQQPSKSLSVAAEIVNDKVNDNDHTIQQTKMKTKTNQKTAALLLSGGVDSSVALHLLLQQGYNVTAFYLKIWLEDELSHLGTCPWEDDVLMCQQVCDQMNVPLEIISLQKQYHKSVMEHTLQEAKNGRTPNPDILCNSRIKFGTFLELLETNQYTTTSTTTNFTVIASGHYAQIQYNTTTNKYQLFRAPDPIKDQSYFLCALSQKQLSKLIFPIGHLEKYQVRELAQSSILQLPNRYRPDSQGLCFLGKLKFNDFLQAHLGSKPGNIINAVSGDVIGRHNGVWYHTVGQRKGLGPYLHPLATSQGPWYVVAKDPSRDIVYASNQYDQEIFEQARSEFHVEDIHWMGGSSPPLEVTHLVEDNDNDDGNSLYSKPLRLEMKIRHGPRLVGGTLELLVLDDPNDDHDHDNKNQINVSNEGRIRLDEKDGGLAPGQYVVFYSDQAECLGGGIISERHWAQFLLQHEPTQQQLAPPPQEVSPGTQPTIRDEENLRNATLVVGI